MSIVIEDAYASATTVGVRRSSCGWRSVTISGSSRRWCPEQLLPGEAVVGDGHGNAAMFGVRRPSTAVVGDGVQSSSSQARRRRPAVDDGVQHPAKQRRRMRCHDNEGRRRGWVWGL
nr:hypothetical protein Iba_chr05cCG0810 [Ipomoea batatas]